MKAIAWFVATAILLMGGAFVFTLGMFLPCAEQLMVVGLSVMLLSGATWNKVEEIESNK